jgi:hypothetical protein
MTKEEGKIWSMKGRVLIALAAAAAWATVSASAEAIPELYGDLEAGGPYQGVATVVPGEWPAMNFDVGGEGIAYHEVYSAPDRDDSSLWERPDDDVNVKDGSVQFIASGEWLRFTVDIRQEGEFSVYYSLAGVVGPNGEKRSEVDIYMVQGEDSCGSGQRWGVFTDPKLNTGGWENFKMFEGSPIVLQSPVPALKKLTLGGDTAGSELTYITVCFAKASQINLATIKIGVLDPRGDPYGPQPVPVPGVILAREFDEGGQGIAYNDVVQGSDAEVDGADYPFGIWERPGELVNVMRGAVGFVWDGEWIRYTVDIDAEGEFTVFYNMAGGKEQDPPSVEMWLTLDGNSCDDEDARQGYLYLESLYTGDWYNYESFRANTTVVLAPPVDADPDEQHNHVTLCWGKASNLNLLSIVIMKPYEFNGATCENESVTCPEGMTCRTERSTHMDWSTGVDSVVTTHSCIQDGESLGPCTLSYSYANSCGLGHCTERGASYSCDCLEGFSLPSDHYGNENCYLAEVCNPGPCGDHGYCTRGFDGNATCSCSQGWSGDFCNFFGLRDPFLRCDLETEGSPPPEGVVCVPLSADNLVEPHVYVMYEDNNCGCFEGGECLDDGTCKCPFGRTGTYCEFADACAELPGTTCEDCVPPIVSPPSGDFLCGKHGVCSVQPALGYGTYYYQMGANFECTCDEHSEQIYRGYGPNGQTCVPKFMGSCAESPDDLCMHGGECIDDFTGNDPSFTCKCPDGWFTDICEHEDICAVAAMRGESMCPEDQDCVPELYCSKGGCMSSYSCTLPGKGDVGPCSTADAPNCANGGKCVDEFRLGYWQSWCECAGDWVGPECETQKCENTYCYNGGECKSAEDEVGPYSYCECPPEFPSSVWGFNCNTSPCETDCGYHGTCTYMEAENAYSCVCDEGWFTSEGGYSDCSVSECEAVHGVGWCGPYGQCIKDAGSGEFVCECTAGYSGETCDVFDYCEPNPCANGGKCYRTAGFEPTPFMCSCAQGWGGDLCDQRWDQNGCDPDCRGMCLQDSNGTYSCQCTGVYVGPNCTQPIGCGGDPCQNGGTCLVGGICSCPLGYEGFSCEIVVGPLCDHGICFNGGDCDEKSDKCICAGDWQGRYCNTEPDHVPVIQGGPVR